MASFNKVILLGNLTKAPELRYAQSSNIPVARTSIAVNNRYRDKEDVMFIDIVIFGKQAEILSSYAEKGTQLLVEGRLSQSIWEQQDGQKRSKHEVIVNNFQFSGSKNSVHKPPQESDFANHNSFQPTDFSKISDFDDDPPF